MWGTRFTRGKATMNQQERFEFIEAEIDRAFVHADDEWKQEYYQNAAKYLAEHRGKQARKNRSKRKY